MKRVKPSEFKEECGEDGILCGYSRQETVFYLSLNLAAFYTGKDRRTVANAARDLESFVGPKGARLYRSAALIRKVITGDD
jgi:hypothetical protein